MYQEIIDYFYGEGESKLKTILMVHSRGVADKALRICDAHPELKMNREFVEQAAMLHDIGIIRCHAPGIECHGTEPYICHGRIGASMLREEFDTEPTPTPSPGRGTLNVTLSTLNAYARVCERHTGAGLTREEIIKQNLPLPWQDFLPETMEEKLICYADKFFSKTRPDAEKSFEHVLRSLEKFGPEGVERFLAWHRLFAL
ncbi:MAG: HDIG domain-containing protein [Prevotella sp.]|nr:HDIG domain-containing protein [Prevotella sp.]